MTIRRVGTPPPPARRHRLRPGAYAVIRARGGVLLTVGTDGESAPELQLPGGGIDPGEQPLAALRREVIEETGWSVHALRRLGTYRIFDDVAADAFAGGPTHGRPGADGDPGDGPGPGRVWAEKVCAVYAARAARRLGPPAEPGHRAVVLGVEDALRALSGPGQGAMLRRARAMGLV